MKAALVWIRITSFVFVIAISTPNALAQITEATLQGKVVDAAGQVLVNRFTDGLRLPSEDEAIRVYKETYGSHWK